MEPYEILLPLALILCLTKILGLGAQKIGLPAVIGMLVAGVLIGLLRYIPSSTLQQILFSDDVSTWLSISAKIGVVLIMFSTGLGTDVKQLKAAGKPSLIITAFGVILPLALGTLTAWWLLPDEFILSPDNKLITYLFYGAILTATSVSVTVTTLKELGKLNTKVGTSIVAAAVIDDIIGIIVLSILTGFTSTTGTEASSSFLPTWWVNAAWWLVCIKIVIFFVLAIALGLLIRRGFDALERKYPHNRRVPILAICVCFVYSYVAEKFFGVADITGAYVAGLILGGRLQETTYVEVKTDILGYMFLSPIFFANIGINLDFSGFSGSFLLFGIVYVIVGILGKLVGCGGAAKLCGYSNKDSFRVGCGMIVRAEVVLICTQKGIDAGLVSSAVYPFVFMIILISSILAPILLKLSYEKDKTPIEVKE